MRGNGRHPPVRSRCGGQRTISTQVDEDTVEFLDNEAEAAGVSRADFIRLLIDTYRDSTGGELSCGSCEAPLNLAGVIYE